MSAKSEKWKAENAFFLNKNTGRVTLNALCKKCIHECKQSHKVKICACPHYLKAGKQ
jgi:hypothetical protein